MSTRVGAIPGALVEGETGFLVEPGDAGASRRGSSVCPRIPNCLPKSFVVCGGFGG